MKKDASSFTQNPPAIMRAVHQVLDDEPRILVDPIAVGLIESTSREEILAGAEGHRTPLSKLRRSIFVMRSRFTEDRLQEAVASGIRQYVLIGAGLDTFAYRQPPWAKDLTILEVDHPASEASKRERLDRKRFSVPGNLRFCPCDFENTSLTDALTVSSFDRRAATLFSWLGVTQYLTNEAIDRTLRFVAALPRASEIVFEFCPPQNVLDGLDAELAALASRRAAEIGEPWITRLDADEWRQWLARLGFSKFFLLTPEDAQERYFKARRDGLRAARFASMIQATV